MTFEPFCTRFHTRGKKPLSLEPYLELETLFYTLHSLQLLQTLLPRVHLASRISLGDDDQPREPQFFRLGRLDGEKSFGCLDRSSQPTLLEPHQL